jgi:CHASE2 domain-containing sensor protein
MIRSFNQKRTAALTAIAAVVAVAVLVAPRLLPFLEVIENWVGDLRVALLAPPAPRNPDIVILSITEETLAQLPYRSPVDRGFLAGVLDALAAKKVRAVGVDILFDQPTEPDKDAALARAIAAFPAPLVVAWADAEGGLTESQIAFMNRFLPDAVKGRANILRDRRDGTVRERRSPTRPFPSPLPARRGKAAQASPATLFTPRRTCPSPGSKARSC